MAQIVKLRRSSVIGKKPTNAQLELGELSINTSDGKVYFAKSGSLGPTIEELVSTNTVNTGSLHLTDNVTASFFTGSFIGDGSGLYNIPASGVTDLNLSQITSGSVTASISPNKGFRVNTKSEISGSLIVGSGVLDSIAPEILHVQNSGSYNIAHFDAFNDNYAQVNIQNHSTSSAASSDLVLTADNGNENIHFVDLGINSSTYDNGFVGYENDAYLINAGRDLYVGTIGGPLHPNAKLKLFAQNLWDQPQVVISGSKQIGFNTEIITSGYAYEFSGSIKANHNLKVDGAISSSFITGAFFGDATGLYNIAYRISGSDIYGNTTDKTYTKLQFDDSTGLNVEETEPGTAFISIGSHFKDIYVQGQTILSATGSDAFEIIPDGGIEITTSITDTNANGYVKELKISANSLSQSLSDRIDAITGSITGSGGNVYVLDEGYSLGQATQFNFIGNGVSATVTDGTASINIPGGGSGGNGALSDGSYVILNQTSASTTWTFNHALGQKYPIIQVFDIDGKVVIPSEILMVDSSTAIISFPTAQAGRAVASLGTGPGGLTQFFTAATTWTLEHNMGTRYPMVTVYDTNYNIIFPNRIHSIDENTIQVQFSSPVAGTLNVAKGGHIISGSVNFSNIDTAGSGIVSSSVQVAHYGYATTGSNTFTRAQNIRNAQIDATCVTLIPNSDTTIFDLGAFDGANIDYVIKSGSNMRAGQLMAVWNGSAASYNETSTLDLGDTTNISLKVDAFGIVSADIIAGTWTVEALYRALGCSGGGGGNEPSPSPTPSNTPTPTPSSTETFGSPTPTPTPTPSMTPSAMSTYTLLGTADKVGATSCGVVGTTPSIYLDSIDYTIYLANGGCLSDGATIRNYDGTAISGTFYFTWYGSSCSTTTFKSTNGILTVNPTQC
jgi:hypothetical protein